jgi:hypothetical protein
MPARVQISRIAVAVRRIAASPTVMAGIMHEFFPRWVGLFVALIVPGRPFSIRPAGEFAG